MAKTVGDLLIKLEAKGLESVTALKSALRTLGQASATSDKQLEKLRQEITQFGKSSKLSQQSIRGQIDAFKGLKQQATIGSTVYRKLGKDIDALTQSLDRLNRKEEETGRKRSPAQIASEITSAIPEKTTKQLQAQQEMLQKAKVSSDEYTQGLTRINAITQELTRSQQRQVVIANSIVAANKAAAAANVSSKKIDIERINTTAALKQRIAELAQDLDNIDVGSKEYITTSNRLKDTQEELNIVLGISSKAFDELSRAQERAERRAAKLAGIQAAQAGAIGTRDPGTGAMIAGGSARASLVQQPVREISGLYRSIGDIGMSKISADIDRMGKSYQEVTQDIREATLASNGSVNSLQAQRASWAQLRAGLSPTSKAYQDVGREIEKVDRRLEKLNRRRRRPTIGGIASGLGGIAAGGVFGGPEGAVGGAIGGAVGGVAGVAAGAAIGAQVKMLREALGATSDYAAELQKLEIALEGVAGARYTDALKVAANVTRDFNVPLAVSTRGITRLSAAIIGAGGNVDDAEVVFRNITSAIKATGGGAQDVESAITAMVQTFSKGKVSAEELSGQLGERLPGAVTKFAEANNMTLPELQKAFKAGTVGLDQLMKFIISLGPEYEATARRIADSSADAGAKATVAFEQVRREIGEALQPIGAELQEAFAEFALEVLPAVKAAAVAAADGMKVLMDATAALIANFKEILIIAGAAGIALVITNLSAIMLGLAAALGKATLAMKAFTAASLLNPWVALAAGITAATVAIIKHTQRHKEFNKAVMEGSVTNKEANDRLRELNQEIKELEELKEKTGNNQMLIALTSQINETKKAAEELKLAMKIAAPYTVAGITYDPTTGRAINAPMSYTPTDFPDATPEGGGTGGGRGRELMSEVELQLRRQMREEIERENLVKQSLVQLELDLLAAAREVEDVNRRTNLQEKAQFDHQQRMNDIADKGLKIFERQEEMRERALDHVRQATIAASGLSEAEMARLRIAEELADFQEEYKGLFSDEKMLELLKELEEALNKVANKADDTGESFDELFRKKLDDMINVAPKLANVAANAIGQISSGLVEMIATGEANFKKMAASILKEIAKILMQAAIARTIQMFLKPSANGNVIQGGSIKPYAKGGVVAGPTVFPMAGGDVGLMGEAGPEAIMPLKRGNNGKLGVEVAGRSNAIDAMNRYSVRNNAGGSAGLASSGNDATEGSQSVSQPIDVRYTVERINSVDYVTADQFQAGMRRAADEGAKQGEQKTLKRLQMSSGTRKRLGM